MTTMRVLPACVLLLAWSLTARECAAASRKSRGPIRDAIENGDAAAYDRNKCVWRRGNDRDLCPDPDVHVHLYTPDRPRRSLRPAEQSDWLRQDYDPIRENVFLIHGYNGESRHLEEYKWIPGSPGCEFRDEDDVIVIASRRLPRFPRL